MSAPVNHKFKHLNIIDLNAFIRDDWLMQRIAIIGAGLSGVTLANSLKEHFKVSLFEKSYSPGGRIASRNVEPYSFDHGAQYFKVKSKAFQDLINPLLSENVVAPWQARFVEMCNQGITKQTLWDDKHPHYVGVPNNRAFVEHLSRGLSITLHSRVVEMKKVNQQWALKAEGDAPLGLFDWVVCAVPVPQTQALLAKANLKYNAISGIKMQACYALMLGFEDKMDLGFDAAMVKDETISWISNNSSKPMREKGFSLLINSTNDWADTHFNQNDDWVIERMKSTVSNIINQDLSNPQFCALKRWKYANCKRQDEQPYLIDNTNKIGLCGDWFMGGRIESAFKSGHQLALAMLKNAHV